MTIRTTTQVLFKLPSESEDMVKFESEIDQSWRKRTCADGVIFAKEDIFIKAKEANT